MSTDVEVAAMRRKILKYGAILGVVLGLVCSSLPEEYQRACGAITQIAGLTCGTGG